MQFGVEHRRRCIQEIWLTPTASTARWRPRARSRWSRWHARLSCCWWESFWPRSTGGIPVPAVGAYDPKTATPLTVARYGYYFGERSVIRHKLWVSSVQVSRWSCSRDPRAAARARPLHGSLLDAGRRDRRGSFARRHHPARVGRRLLRLPGQQAWRDCSPRSAKARIVIRICSSGRTR